MLREMAMRGPGDYLAAGPTFPLLEMKCIPEYQLLFEKRLGWGKMYRSYPPVLVLNEAGRMGLFGSLEETETRIIFGAGIKPESLESATVKAAHLDEVGQKRFLRASHEAVQGRLSIHRGRILYTTTPYQLGWLKTEVYDRAKVDARKPVKERMYETVQFSSIMNPAFSKAEFEEMKAKMPSWKFKMRYMGEFERPAGIIYDSFVDEPVEKGGHISAPFPIPRHWKRFVGADFGGVNQAALFWAKDPNTGICYAYAEYWPREKRSSRQHAKALLKRIPKDVPFDARGGAPSEDQQRADFSDNDFYIQRPESGAKRLSRKA